MNICVVSQQVKKTFSGIGLYTYHLINTLLKDGHRVWVVTSKDQSPEGELPYSLISVDPPIFQKNQARWIGLSLNFARALRELEQREAIDIIHFTDARESLFFRSKTPVVGNINDTYSADLKSPGYYKKYYQDWKIRWIYYVFVHSCERIALNQLDAVIANSNFTRQIISSRYKVPAKHLYLCYKSVNAQKYQLSLEKKSQNPLEKQRVLFVGTNMQRKGLPAIIKAAPAVLRVLSDVEFLVVGEDTAVPELKRLSRDLQVDEKFHFLGWKSQTELVDIYASASLFVMPSLVEALGVAFLEAMAAGLPVIGTCVGGIPEIIQDGVNGELVSPDHSDELAEAIIHILSNKMIADRYVNAGFDTLKTFSVENMMARVYEIYQLVSTENKQAGAA